MIPRDTDARLQALLSLVTARLGIPHRGDDLAIRLGWARDRGAGLGKRARIWIDEGKKPPRQFTDLMHMLGEAGLLQPEAEATWRDISLEEAERVVETAQAAAMEKQAQGLAEHEEHARDTRKSA